MYNKLFGKILDSSIWLEPSPTRIVWLMFIASMDENGMVVFASIANVAHRAIISTEDAAKAIHTLESPDPNSSDPDHEGRRVERVPGGWVVLNAEKYRDLVTREMVKAQTRERVARHRANKRNGVVTGCNGSVTPSEEDTETKAKELQGELLSSATIKDSLIKEWGATGFGKIQVWSAARQTALHARLREPFFQKNWRAAIKRMVDSEFLNGKNDRGWKASIDWFLKPESVARIMEGKYDNRKTKTTQAKASTREDFLRD